MLKFKYENEYVITIIEILFYIKGSRYINFYTFRDVN